MASNMKAVKLRIKSVQSTMQITKAMELVASSKLRKAKERAEVCRPYFTELHETLKEIARENTDFSSVYAKESSNNKTCYVVIAGDRGLAGGYNTNLFKCLEASAEGKDYMVLPVGKKAVEYFRQRGIEALTEQFAEVQEVFLWRTVLRWQICSAQNFAKEPLAILNYAILSLIPCFLSSRRYFPCFL